MVAGLLAGVAVLGAVVALLAPGMGGDGGPSEAAPAAAIDPDLVRVGTAALPLIDVYASPSRSVVTQTLEHPTPAGGPLVFVIEAEWEDWLKVRVPAAPAGEVGWIRAVGVEISEHHTRISIDLHDHLLVARSEGAIVLRAPIAVGSHDKPKPGTTFVAARIDPSERKNTYGNGALALAGYANGPETLFRGSGLVGLHTAPDDASLGQTVRRGSIGLAPQDAAALFDLVPLGTPVVVTE